MGRPTVWIKIMSMDGFVKRIVFLKWNAKTPGVCGFISTMLLG